MTKRFGALTALDDVSIKVAAGIVPRAARRERRRQVDAGQVHHGLLPAPTRGQVLVDGSEVDDPQPARCRGAGIGMVYQHFTLVPSLTAAENLVISRADVPAVIDWKAEKRAPGDVHGHACRSACRSTCRCAELAAGEKQKLEILKQLYLDSAS